VETYLVFAPARRNPGDARTLALSVALSAGIWAAASIGTVLISAVGNGVSRLMNQRWDLDFFHQWFAPALSGKVTNVTDVLPGAVLSALSVVAAAVAAHIMLEEGGRQRRIKLTSRLVLDSNPRVWNWFLQSGESYVYRVTLNTGVVYLGQIGEYSNSPDDDVQEIVLSTYSRYTDDGSIEDVSDGAEMMIPREAISRVERLVYRLTEADGTAVAVVTEALSEVAP
jgi:hypothetical protein